MTDRRVGVVAVAQTRLAAAAPSVTTPEMAFDVATRAVASSGFAREAIDLTVSASSDVLEGRPFNFVKGLEALGTWPAVAEKHLEMDGAWAAWHAWTAILAGEARAALVVAWSKTSEASPHHVFNTRLDPFTLAPLGLDDVTCAALQADAFCNRTGCAEADLDAVVAASGSAAVDDGDRIVATPLRRRHLPRLADGACAVVLAAEDALGREPLAWIAGADHRAETGALGHRDLSRAPAATQAAGRAAALAGWGARDAAVAEVGASYAHQDPMLREALGLSADATVNPSGGPLAADPTIATGLVRLAEASARTAGAGRALAHAATGPAMQQHLVWLLEAP